MGHKTSTKIIFAAVFVALVFVSMKVNFSTLMGAENQFFTIFQFFGPIAGGILGSGIGAIIVAVAQLVNISINALLGNEVSFVTVLRIAPMIVAAYYFGTRRKHASIIIPTLAIIAFIAHPVGREVWYYAVMFWTIPIVATFFKGRLLARSYGATFTAHSIGGAVWIYAFPTTPQLWISLIPIVIAERALFGAGIAVSYVAANTLLQHVESKVPFISVDKNFVVSKFWKQL